MRKIACIFLVIFIPFNCVSYEPNAPLPGEEKFFFSVNSIPEYPKTVYLLPNSILYPGTFHNGCISYGKQIAGCHFILMDKIIFTVYDNKTESYLPQYVFNYSDIVSLSVVDQAPFKILRFKLKGEQNSILFMNAINLFNEKIDKDEVVKFIIDCINRTM